MQVSFKFTTLLFIIAVMCSCSSTKSNDSFSLKTYNIDDLEGLIERESRPIAIFIHAEWCTYCRNMEQTTFKNDKIKNILNTDFYFVSLDGESENDIRFQEKTYRFIPHGAKSGTHELASHLASMNNQVVYPTLTFLNSHGQITKQYNSFLSASELLPILKNH